MISDRNEGNAGAERFCVKLLAIRPRTREELARRMAEKGFGPGEAEAELDRLSRSGLIDDERFARDWIEERMRTSPRSRAMLEDELARKGVPSGVSAGALEGLEDIEVARGLVRSKLTAGEAADDKARARIFRFLAGRGFDADTAEEAIVSELGYGEE